MMPGPFDYITDLSYEKKDLLNQDFVENNKTYSQFMINKGFSYFIDTILHSAEMNLFEDLSNSAHNKYMLEAIKPRKRFSRWSKPLKDVNLELVQNYYKCGKREAQEYVKILSNEEIDTIKKLSEKGGVKGKR